MEIQLPTSTAVDIGAEVTNGLVTYSLIVSLLIGIIIAFFVIEVIIGTLRKDK